MKTYIRVIVGDAKVLKRPHRRDIIVELIDEIGKPIAEPVRFYQEIDKVLSKQILAWHRIPTPQVAVFRRAVSR